MAAPLMKSVSGIRGIVGESLNPELILKVGAAFARYVKKGTVVIGRDTRPTGEAIANGIRSALALHGCNVVDIGIVPTPTVQVMVEELGADGGIVISASHNPIEWNAFKLIGKNGSFLGEKEIKKFFPLIDQEQQPVRWNGTGTISVNLNADQVHISRVLRVVNKSKIAEGNFTVVLDSVNGAGSLITQKLLSELGCRIIPINCDTGGIFPRGAEPLAENLGDLCRYVNQYRADIGFAQDPDADRLAVVDENGRPIGEEYTIALVTEHLLSREKGRVVVNLSTTRAIDDIAEKHGVQVKRTKVGEINVVEEMAKKPSRIGGEGNGGVISPEVHLGRDSLVGIVYILEMMAERKKKVSELVAQLPAYVMKKGKVTLSKQIGDTFFTKVKGKFKKEKISDIDGLRIDFEHHPEFAGGWVHLRASNTEPVFRIIAEGIDARQAQKIYAHFADLVGK